MADIIGYARLVKCGNKVTTYYSKDTVTWNASDDKVEKITWNLSDQVEVFGDFDIYWPIYIEKEESDEQT